MVAVAEENWSRHGMEAMNCLGTNRSLSEEFWNNRHP